MVEIKAEDANLIGRTITGIERDKHGYFHGLVLDDGRLLREWWSYDDGGLMIDEKDII